MKIPVLKGQIMEMEWGTFTLIFDAQTEEERKALIACLRDRKNVKVTIEEADE